VTWKGRDNVKKYILTVRLNEEEKNDLMALCKVKGLNKSETIRQMIYSEIVRIGGLVKNDGQKRNRKND